jgi:hypothetical protein
MSTWIINSDSSLQAFMGDMRELFRVNKFVKVSAKVGKSRSLDQNAISHAWYEQLARELKEDDALGWKQFCKLHYGVPILRAEDADFREFYNLTLLSRTYEQKIAAMKFVPVTSIMTKPQLSAYLEVLHSEFARKGVLLEFMA